ncbi:Thiol-disulfide oxidoreductase ResA [Aquisphaera giovannonii]|uniref:Thiol-disulfide oxidoreductase ResA n=1 Tax=Aquisphaera giovannonii TaxID=406548 RepID=A0A5B9W6P8_9BACT|nr:TlpA disulfide reductase family protein [Aquisphaera giovannonii]QEH35650.1 Thiol-disulfide oxidoreductase ResA [Aquisphaera giovannonii]
MSGSSFVRGSAGIVRGAAALGLSLSMAWGVGAARGQEPDSVQAIHEDFANQFRQLEKTRLDRLGRLAARQDPAAAAATYEELFRLAISANLFREAEPAASTVIRVGSPSHATSALAHLVKIVAEADRGAFEESLAALKVAVENAAQDGVAGLQSEEIIGITDAYYQRLVHADQIPVALKAFKFCAERAQRPVVKEFLAERLRRLEAVGKPAPAIRGTDLDGRPFDLAALKGKVVLVEFWASWCLPTEAQVEQFQQAIDARKDKDLVVVGINLDTLQGEGLKPETILPNVRRFLLDHNVRWPTLINGKGEKDYAAAFGVVDIPASVLIGKDGNIVQLDLVRQNLGPVLDRELAR